MDNTAPPQTPFVGRQAELATLQQAWDRAAAGAPQFLVWTADTGLGKTRLVQAFYAWLSTQRDAREPEGYWPDQLTREGRTLLVNPELAGFGRLAADPPPRAPWLWWGIGFGNAAYDKGRRSSECGLTAQLGDLEPHLRALERRLAHLRETRGMGLPLADSLLGLGAAVGELLALTVVPGGALLAKAPALLDLGQRALSANRVDTPFRGFTEERAALQDDAVARLLTLFRLVLSRGMPAADGTQHPIPCALILDDAQWADLDTLRFVEALYRDALRHGWPLLVLCTHWQQEWNTQLAEARTPNPGTEPRSIADVCERLAAGRGYGGAGCCQVQRLAPLPDPDLRPVIAAALPGVTDAQAAALLARVGGNPGFLVDLIGYALTEPALFATGDPSGPLTADGFADLQQTAELDHQDLIRKRFRELTPELKQTLALASYQGARFLDDLLLAAAAGIDPAPCNQETLDRAEHPHAIIERTPASADPAAAYMASEFRQRAWYEVAHRQLDKPQHRGHQRAFADRLRRVLTDWRAAGRLEALAPRDRALALNLLAAELERVLAAPPDDTPARALLGAVLADLVQLHQAAGEPRQAAAAAGQLARWMPPDGWPADWVDLNAQFSAAVAAAEFSAAQDALTLYGSVIAGFEAAGYRTGPPARQNDLATVYSNRGIAHRGRGAPDAAIADYDAAIGFMETLRTALGAQWAPAMQNDLATVYSNRGIAHADHGAPDAAIADFDAAIALREALRTALGAQWAPAMQNDLATVYSNRGIAHADHGAPDAAIADFDAAIGLREALRNALGAQWAPAMQNDLAAVYTNRGNAHAGRGAPDAAIADYDAAIKLREALRTALGAQWPPAMQNDLATAYSNRGIAHAGRGASDAAIADYDAAIALRETLRTALGAQWPPAMQNALATVYSNRGAAHADRGAPDAAIADYDAAIGFMETLRTALGAQWPPAMQNDLGRVYTNRGNAHAGRGAPDAAIADYDAAIGFMETLRTALGAQWPPGMQNDLATVYSNRGAAHVDRGALDAAIADYDAAIGLGEALRTALGAQWPPAMQNDLASVCFNRGLAHGNAGRHDAAAADFERAVAIARPVVAAHPDIPAWRDTLARAEQNLALARRLAAGDVGEPGSGG
ncbi:AAA family ATPase [Thiohalocapsa sp. ML1]|uniref:AAA family ATPase n=1 Tax=Thiohalocapsa sp. ML1 TaxID=1431688 RepID=UPI0007320E9C|nr:AAA family ATPase [Thiohalocapsa sp. ML1]